MADRIPDPPAINDPTSYKHCHYLPEWLPMFEMQTPKSIWIDKDNLPDNPIDVVMEKLLVFGSEPVIVKDYVKSEKHRWAEACFIPDPSQSREESAARKRACAKIS
jgi:hypothetical protein